jgi:hypothetical protein
VLEADELAAADAELQTAYRPQPEELIDAARRLAAETTPAW